ncbi:hypothetical protein [Chromobacterium amazonense]|uniref:hypothetical protein n=1 Tax=Chromobacterium amazonense TaxID=1382803 RepID=UPI003F79A3BA
MPYKYNEERRRRHIKKMKFHVTNWREYDAALWQRGSLTFSDSGQSVLNSVQK